MKRISIQSAKEEIRITLQERNKNANVFAAQFKKELRSKIDQKRQQIRDDHPAIPRVKNKDMSRSFRAIDRLIIMYAKGTQSEDWACSEKALKGIITLSNSINKKVARAAMKALTDFVLPDLDLLVKTNANDAILMLMLLKQESLNLKFRLSCEEYEDRWLSSVVRGITE